MQFTIMQDFLDQDIQFLPGVGPKRAEILKKELQISTFRDLVYHFPYRYIDRTRVYTISELNSDMQFIQLKGKITGYEKSGFKGKKRLVAGFTDGTGSIELLWFRGDKWIIDTYKPGTEYIIFGKPSIFNNQINIIHPDIDDVSKAKDLLTRMQPMYSSTEKLKDNFLSSKSIHKLVNTLLVLSAGKIEETLPPWLLKETSMISLVQALQNIHFPSDTPALQKAETRLKFEELFFLQLNILRIRAGRILAFKGYNFSRVGENFNRFYKENLPFELTGAQKKVLKEIRRDMGTGKQMNRLLQGDVGSGKTLVALMSMLIALDNGFQSAFMAPTEILAIQHFRTLTKFLGGLNISVELLTGSTKKAERDRIHASLEDGSLHILVGTHALIEDKVKFKDLGLVIIDEQHRFGVAQRAQLWKKSDTVPHVLVMTATPIPRTLAMTLYGDLDVSIIDELPPGRKPIKTIHITDSKRMRMHGFLREQIAEGRQVYIVYPLIKESEKMDYKDLTDGYESIVRAFPPPKYQVSVVHGKMKSEEKEISMKHFKEGRTHIMVATTVIEVGVDIPNASVMVIESTERFGLSQLHQLRGRVGRGADQSYCILMSGYKLSADAKKRIETMVRTNDGFEIAETDLQLRGPGDIEGTQQSGEAFDLKIAHIGKDGQILQYARDIASRIIDDDPEMIKETNVLLKKQLKKLYRNSVNWGVIS
jgi:ATP-dependent DNA helicase RecG